MYCMITSFSVSSCSLTQNPWLDKISTTGSYSPHLKMTTFHWVCTGLSVCLLIIMHFHSCHGRCNDGSEDCHWTVWMGWESRCSRTCGGGTQMRKRKLCCNGQPISQCLPRCGLQLSGFYDYRTCNGICLNGGTFIKSVSNCNCPNEHYGSCCEKATCSWKLNRCWPGNCAYSRPYNCKCETGFKKDYSTTSCDITTKADLHFCKMSVENIHGEIRQTDSSSKSTACSNEVGVYINIKPISLSFKITADFTREGMTTEPPYILPGSTKIGIVEGTVSLTKEDISGTSTHIGETSLYGGGDCKTPLSSTSTSVLLDCNQNMSLTTNLSNGQRICAMMNISSGGSFKYRDYSGSYRGTDHFTPVIESKMLCFKYDDVPPVHCAATSSCKQEPLSLSSRVTKSANITVSISGWFDPHPQHGKPDQASEVDCYKLEVYGMKHLDPTTLTVDYTTSVFTSGKLLGPNKISLITLTDEPAMYVTYLEVHDVAGNVRFARRFLMYDNSSTLDVREDKHLRVVSASTNTNYMWQINHGKINLDWRHRYHKDYYINHNMLAPIKADTGNSISGVYDQNTGVLPVTGTENINGITSFKYQWTLNNGSRTPWTLVPDFTNQSLSLDLNLADGETYEVWIKAEDIMQNSVVESVVVHIDRSAPTVIAAINASESTMLTEPEVMTSSSELNTGDIIFVRAELNDGISTPTLEFQAYDIHSGISSVGWTLRPLETDSYVRSGHLTPRTLTKNNIDNKLQACATKTDCYCPSVGPCELFSYSLPLDLIRPSGSEMDNFMYNHTVNITLDVTNGAKLTTSLQRTATVQQKYTKIEGFWTIGVTVGLAVGGAGLVLLAYVGVFMFFKRKYGSSTQGRRSVTDSSPASQTGAEGSDHIYDGLRDAKNTLYETIHNNSSAAAENVYENVGYDDSATVHTRSENFVVYEKTHDRATVHTPSENVYENFVVYKKTHDHATIHTPSDNIYANTGVPPNEC